MNEAVNAVADAGEAKPVNSSEVELIINKHVIAASGVGLVPVPLIDLVGVGAIQLRMIRKLADAYGVDHSDSRVRSVLMALVGGSIPAFGALPLFSLAQSLPVVGWTVGASAASILSGASTYAVGHIMRRHFEAGGNFEDFKASEVRESFDNLVEKGKSVVKNVGRKSRSKADFEAGAAEA